MAEIRDACIVSFFAGLIIAVLLVMLGGRR
jgi:hypothetical protein